MKVPYELLQHFNEKRLYHADFSYIFVKSNNTTTINPSLPKVVTDLLLKVDD